MNRRKFMSLSALVGAACAAPVAAVAYEVVLGRKKVYNMDPNTFKLNASGQWFGVSKFKETNFDNEFEAIWVRR